MDNFCFPSSFCFLFCCWCIWITAAEVFDKGAICFFVMMAKMMKRGGRGCGGGGEMEEAEEKEDDKCCN